MVKNHYRTLGVAENATDQEIRQAYRQLAKRYHPDVVSGYENLFTEITAAYNILSDPILRRQYDMKRQLELLSVFSPQQTYHSNKSGRYTTTESRRERYADSVWEWANVKRTRTEQYTMQRRRQILIGMSITFVLFISTAIWFDNWLREERENQSLQLEKETLLRLQKMNALNEPKSLSFMASPFDSLFGDVPYDDFSPNALTVISPPSEAVVCLTEANPPCHTIRNVYVPPNLKFVFRGLPDGDYLIKVYLGKNWVMHNQINGKETGSFSVNERYLLREGPPIHLFRPTRKKPYSNFADTINLQFSQSRFLDLPREVFFARELTLPLGQLADKSN